MNRRAIIKAPVLIAGAVVLPKTVLAKDEERLEVVDWDKGLVRGVVLRRGETWPGDITIADDCEFDLSRLANCYVQRDPTSPLNRMMDRVGEGTQYEDDGRCVWLTCKLYQNDSLLRSRYGLLTVIDAGLIKYSPGLCIPGANFFGASTVHKAMFYNVALDRVR